MHRHETEIFYILEGEFEITLGDQKLRTGPGGLVVGPRDIPHTFRNVGTSQGRLLLTVIPGCFANYFIDADNIADRDRAKIKALAAKYGCEILE